MRYVLLSYTGFTNLVTHDHISEEICDTALLFFSCNRKHALWEKEEDYNEAKSIRKWTHGDAAHTFTRNFILKAETEGRAFWWNQYPNPYDGELEVYRSLLSLIQKHGGDIEEARRLLENFHATSGSLHYNTSVATLLIDKIPGFKGIQGMIIGETTL